MSPQNLGGAFAAQQLIVFRLPAASSAQFREKCRDLENTKYKKFSKREEAPAITDCLTAVEYLYRTVAKIDLHYIGEMPKSLLQRGWRILEIDSENLREGDLIFLGTNRRLITHVVVAVSQKEVFHSSPKKGGAIERISDLFARYKRPLSPEEMLAYKDPRAL